MVVILRKDLKLTKGKLISQCCHAALGAFKFSLQKLPNNVRRWENEGSAKIVLAANSDQQLQDIHRSAQAHSLVAVLIQDAGLTEVKPGTITALAIGPALAESIDYITGHLKLY